MKSRQTIWEARDRQGLKLFTSKPKFLALHDIFYGPRIDRIPKGARVIRRFTVVVANHRSSRLARDYYPPTFKVTP